MLWPTNRKSYMIYRTAPISERLLPPVSRSRHFWRWISQKWYDIQTLFQWNNRDLHTPYSTVSFRMTFEWFSKIFNDTNRRAVSSQQLSSLLSELQAHILHYDVTILCIRVPSYTVFVRMYRWTWGRIQAKVYWSANRTTIFMKTSVQSGKSVNELQPSCICLWDASMHCCFYWLA